MRYGLIAAAQAPFVSSKSTSVCFTSARFYLSIHNVTSHWKSPDRECAVKYLYLYLTPPGRSKTRVLLRPDSTLSMWPVITCASDNFVSFVSEFYNVLMVHFLISWINCPVGLQKLRVRVFLYRLKIWIQTKVLFFVFRKNFFSHF